MHRSSLLLTCLAFVALPGAALANDTETNALGFKAYEKGNYPKAHELFEKALEENPSNAYARLNRARTTTLLNKGKESTGAFDYCELASNWILLALADLSVAVEQNPALLKKIDEDTQGLKALKAREEYPNWRRAAGIVAKEPGAVAKALKATPEWLITSPDQSTPNTLFLRPNKKVVETSLDGAREAVGEWRPKGNEAVEIDPRMKGKASLWKPAAEKYYFGEGQHFFFEVHLKQVGGDEPQVGWLQGTLKAGPLYSDCG
ncbi:MAG TPA: hypothetical protein VE153_28825 [Myxococcus sp.]|nr:hypothetical protein [Myxococcus sp.]